MSQSHEIEGGTTVEAFQEQRSLWERRASRCSGLWGFLTIEIFYMTNFYSMIKQRRKKLMKKNYVMMFQSETLNILLKEGLNECE